MGLVEKLILKKNTIPAVHPPNINITNTPLITSSTLSVPVRPVVQKSGAHRVYPEIKTDSNIRAMH